MARITYRTRLQDLLDKNYLSRSDRKFATGLLEHYNRKKQMSAGRCRWVRTLEARYEKVPTAASPELIAELEKLRARISDGSSWSAGFIESLTEQLRIGRTLSEKQNVTLEKIRAQFSDAAIATTQAFQSTYGADAGMRARFTNMCEYYAGNTGYYSSIWGQAKTAGFDSFVPTEKQYNAITTNKYAVKLISGFEAPPAFPKGSMAMIRGNSLPVMIVKPDCTFPQNPRKGNKVYLVLPVGKAQTIEVEEAGLKKLKIPKKKKAGKKPA
jgi:hypothetical protein